MHFFIFLVWKKNGTYISLFQLFCVVPQIFSVLFLQMSRILHQSPTVEQLSILYHHSKIFTIGTDVSLDSNKSILVYFRLKNLQKMTDQIARISSKISQNTFFGLIKSLRKNQNYLLTIKNGTILIFRFLLKFSALGLANLFFVTISLKIKYFFFYEQQKLRNQHFKNFQPFLANFRVLVNTY